MKELAFTTVEDATKYVEEECKLPFEIVDVQRTWNSDEVNKVWWTDTAFRLSDRPMKKVAHYNSRLQKLVVY